MTNLILRNNEHHLPFYEKVGPNQENLNYKK
jgi:hypothetical protein